MPLVTLDQAGLAYGDVPLLDHAELVLDTGERIALVGRNGSGKSSLLRAIAGEQSLDSGTLWRRPELRIALVAQEPALEPDETLFEAVAAGAGDIREVLVEFHALSQRIATGEDGAVTPPGPGFRMPFAGCPAVRVLHPAGLVFHRRTRKSLLVISDRDQVRPHVSAAPPRTVYGDPVASVPS